MFHKRDKEYKEGIPPSKRLRSSLGDLFLSNKISGQRAQEIFSDAALAGASHVADLAKGSDNPSVERLIGEKPQCCKRSRQAVAEELPLAHPILGPDPSVGCSGSKSQHLQTAVAFASRDALCREGACLWLGVVPGQISFVYTEPSSFAKRWR